MKTLKIAATSMLASVMIFTSCTKEGPIGPAGNNGTNGVANITVTDFTVSAWSSNTTNYYTDLTVPAITQQVQDNGTVQVFMNWNSGAPIWTALPYTFNSTPVYIMNYNTQVGFVVLQWVYNTSGGPIGQDANTVFGTTLTFKVVVIPPAARMAHPHINYHDFNAIQAAFNLEVHKK